MDIEFHYYITFILARKAGFSADESYRIAYSSQYTDDNTYHYFVNFNDGSHYLNDVSQTLDITKPSPKRQKIYPLFHFIPGGEECAGLSQFDGAPYHEFTTIPDSRNAQVLLGAALASGNLYRIGIAVHAYADTWAHQNFVGFEHKLNGKGGLGRLIPNIGHADYMHEPDMVHNSWKDMRLRKEFSHIENDQRFLDAARAVFAKLWKCRRPPDNMRTALKKYDDLQLERQLRDAMDETFFLGPSEMVRIKAYKKICRELDEETYGYDPKKWRHAAVEKLGLETDIFDRYWAKEDFFQSDWYHFQGAVKAHRKRALKRLKPLYAGAGLLI